MIDPNNLPELPKGWVWTEINDILVTLESGGRPKGGVRQIQNGIPSIGGEHLQYNGKFDFSNLRFIPVDFYKKLTRGKIKINDVLVVKDGATTGKTSLVSNSFPYCDAAVNEHVFILRVNKQDISSNYLCFWMQSPFGQKAVAESFQGTAQGGINSSFVKNILPIPPFTEQDRIVNKIEELFTRLDEGVDALKKIHLQLKRYRQSVLKAAFEGKLTAEWRETHNSELEPASVLLERIKTERKKKLGSKYKDLSPVDTSKLQELPEGWEWAKLGELSEVSGGLTKNSKQQKDLSQMPYLRVANVYANELRLQEIETIGVRKENIEKTLLKSGDLLVVEGNGSADQIGRVAIWNGSISPCLHQNHIIKARFNIIGTGKYVLYWLLSVDGRLLINQVSSSTSGLYTLSISKVGSLVVPLATLSEQNMIIQEIERQFSIADEIETLVAQSLKQSERMRQSILKQAFEGKLVPQNPHDEPAEKLLERIKAGKSMSQNRAAPPASKRANRKHPNLKNTGRCSNLGSVSERFETDI